MALTSVLLFSTNQLALIEMYLALKDYWVMLVFLKQKTEAVSSSKWNTGAIHFKPLLMSSVNFWDASWHLLSHGTLAHLLSKEVYRKWLKRNVWSYMDVLRHTSVMMWYSGLTNEVRILWLILYSHFWQRVGYLNCLLGFFSRKGKFIGVSEWNSRPKCSKKDKTYLYLLFMTDIGQMITTYFGHLWLELPGSCF